VYLQWGAPVSDWNPTQYLRFEAERTRPAADLLARVGPGPIRHAVDLGCGPGNSTELLARRFPDADVLGLDSSPAMVEEARRRLPACRFVEADLGRWQPEASPDLLFANAVLQWLPGHDRLLPSLMSRLAPGGTLAVQMPDNLDAPSHRAMRAIAAQGPWADRLRAAAGARTILPPLETYYDMLAPLAASVDVWRTVYHHPMPSAGAIVDWLGSTGLRPFLAPLDPAEQAAFKVRYEAAIDAAYPARTDGMRLLAFERIFIVARRTG
jgi:trans-aconitate 2-methyltransferase